MTKHVNRIVSAFMSYRDLLVRSLLKMSVKPDDVDDILQETLARTIEADTKQSLRFPKSYLYMVSRNIVFREHERRSREVVWEIDEASIESTIPDAQDDVYYCQMLAVFVEAMESLPTAQRRAILLRRIYGLSHQEIAKKMRVSVSSVEKYFAQGIKRCQQVLMQRGYDSSFWEKASTTDKSRRNVNRNVINDRDSTSHEG